MNKNPLKGKKAKEIQKKILSLFKKTFNQSPDLMVQIEHIDSETMKKLNHKHRSINSDTDILSFESPKAIQNVHLGTLYLSKKKILSQSKAFQIPIEIEYAIVLTHGLVHLLGFDHLTPNQRIKMQTEEKKILDQMGIPISLIERAHFE